jgi:hypothetical protein
MKEVVTLSIQNNTNGTIPISILGNNADPMDNSNATTQYAWNLTGFSITNENTIIIQYRSINNPIFSITTTNFQGTSLDDVLYALNLLNLGSFFVTTSGGNTYINNYNQNIAFGVLTILNPTTASTLTYGFSYSGTLASADIYKNTILQLATTSPSTASGNIAVVAGDSIQLDCNTPLTLKGTNVFVYNLTTATYLFNVTQVNAGNLSYTFTIVANNSYLIGMQN